MSVSLIAPALTLPVGPSATALLSRQEPNANAVGANEVAARGSAVAPDRQAAGTLTVAERVHITDSDELQRALKDVQSAISVVTNDLRFSIDEDTGRTIVKIVDRETDKVIKQIPSDELLRMAKALDNLQGLLVRQEV